MAFLRRPSQDLRRWALLQRYDIPDLVDPSATYLTRWRLVETPWFALFLHAIRRPDADRHLHNHPWRRFTTLILRGGYDEAVPAGDPFAADGRRVMRTWTRGSAHTVRLGDYHAIANLHRTPTWTLMFVGHRCADWGYATPQGFVPHGDYHLNRTDEPSPA